MRTKFLLYAIVVALVTTVICWVSMASSTRTGGGNSWRSHSYGSGGGYSGGSHK
ncbi:hypothetical protein [Massilia yuzhufengensis]|uniref:Uncharacterized protein n=1 Tax=Massilia yuzhufengensis TaxID=1164594 RepID=A0A1I1T7J1_9BURK|nr:hypothetical protein [Massilia yuzhufengensis]SFD54604.1 hypothetical protein SAMN05216204_12825 [Massilia yuzhufengensis]